MLKKILIGLFFFFIALTVIGFFLPGKTEVTREIYIDAPAHYIFDEINNIDNWQNWSYIHQNDPEIKVFLSDNKRGIGANFSWVSEEYDSGNLLIVEAIPNLSITTDVRFMEDHTASVAYRLEPETKGTDVTMSFTADNGINPLSRLFGTVVLKPKVNNAFQESLKNLKNVVERKPRFSPAITEGVAPPFMYAGYPTSGFNPHRMDSTLAKLAIALQHDSVRSIGSPLFIHFIDDSLERNKTLFAFPVQDTANILNSSYVKGNVQEQRVIKGTYTGEYQNIESTQAEIKKYIAFKGLFNNGSYWMSFATTPDSARLITEIYYPVTSQ